MFKWATIKIGHKIFWCLIALLLSLACSSDTTGNQSSKPVDLFRLQQGIDSIISGFVPDSRVALATAEISISPTGEYLLKGESNQPKFRGAVEQFLTENELTYIDSFHLYRTQYAVVTNTIGNMRSNPKHSAELVTQALLGQILRIIKTQGSWSQVQSPDDYLGWMTNGSFVKVDSGYWQSLPKLICSSLHTSLLVSPASNAEKVAELIVGNIVERKGQTGDYYFVALPNKQTAYVSKKDMISYQEWIQSSGSNEDIIKTAEMFLGVPYLWGGTSSSGFDCSGFTKTVYYLNGFELPRDASQQVAIGEEVQTDKSLKNLQRGDLLFFGRIDEDQRERITHVGIYLGTGRFINSADRVQIQSLIPGDPGFVQFRLESFLKARRLFDSDGNPVVGRLINDPLY